MQHGHYIQIKDPAVDFEEIEASFPQLPSSQRGDDELQEEPLPPLPKGEAAFLSGFHLNFELSWVYNCRSYTCMALSQDHRVLCFFNAQRSSSSCYS